MIACSCQLFLTHAEALDTQNTPTNSCQKSILYGYKMG